MDDLAGRDRDKADAEIRHLLEERRAEMLAAYDASDGRGKRDRTHWMDLWAAWVVRNGAAPDASPADATVDSERAAYLRASPQERANYDEVSYELAADDEWEAIGQLRETLAEIEDSGGAELAARLSECDKKAKLAQIDRVAAEAAWVASRADAADDRRLNGAAVTIVIHFPDGLGAETLDDLVNDVHMVCREDDNGHGRGAHAIITRDAWGIKPCHG